MTRETFLSELAGLLEVDECAFNEQTLLAELSAWDSMAAIGFIAMADRVGGIVVNPAALAACKTVKDLAELVAART